MGKAARHNYRITISKGEADLQIKQLNGQDHLVVPAIILNEGVIWSGNSDHPALALADEFALFPDAWDGRPVLYGHPEDDGTPVSANSPKRWNDGVIGQLFGSARIEGNKLRSNMWLNKEKTPQEALAKLEGGESMEVSTGLYTLEEDASGEFDGKHYDTIWRNIVPDHLALLPPGTIGACSIEDGCGAPRTNSAGKDTQMAGNSATSTAPASAVQTNASAPVTASSQASPASGTQPVAAAGAPKANCDCPQGSPMTPKNLMTVNMKIDASDAKSFVDQIRGTLRDFAAKMGLVANETSDIDKRVAVETALNKNIEENGGAYMCYVVAMFDKSVVYAELGEDYTWRTYRRNYKISGGGEVTLSGEPEEVRPETQYIPVKVKVNDTQSNTTTEGTTMTQATQAPAAETQAAATPAQTAPVATMEALLAAASPELRSQIEGLIATNKARRETLINMLNDKLGLSVEEVGTIETQLLEKMAAKVAAPATPATPAPAANVATQAAATTQAAPAAQPVPPAAAPAASVNFAGAAGGPVPQANQAGTENASLGFTAPMKVFPINAETGTTRVPEKKAA